MTHATANGGVSGYLIYTPKSFKTKKKTIVFGKNRTFIWQTNCLKSIRKKNHKNKECQNQCLIN